MSQTANDPVLDSQEPRTKLALASSRVRAYADLARRFPRDVQKG